jgi:hypothetical protein
MTAALEGGEWSAARLGRTLPPGKTRYPFYRRPGGPQGRSGRAENLVPTGIRSRTVQPVVSHYTDCATRPTTEMNTRRISWGKDGRFMGLTSISPSCADCYEILGVSVSWSTKVLSRPVNEWLYLNERQ